jgi:hypothetical protein
VAQERDLFLERAIQSQSQWADLSRRAPALPIIDRVTERFIQIRSSRTVADKLSAAGWSWGYCSAVTPNGWRWIVNAHRGDGRRYIVQSDELLTAFLELEATVLCGDG